MLYVERSFLGKYVQCVQKEGNKQDKVLLGHNLDGRFSNKDGTIRSIPIFLDFARRI